MRPFARPGHVAAQIRGTLARLASMWPAEPTPYHLVTLWLAGGLAIGLLTYASFVLDLDVTTTA